MSQWQPKGAEFTITPLLSNIFNQKFLGGFVQSFINYSAEG